MIKMIEQTMFFFFFFFLPWLANSLLYLQKSKTRNGEHKLFTGVYSAKHAYYLLVEGDKDE